MDATDATGATDDMDATDANVATINVTVRPPPPDDELPPRPPATHAFAAVLDDVTALAQQSDWSPLQTRTALAVVTAVLAADGADFSRTATASVRHLQGALLLVSVQRPPASLCILPPSAATALLDALLRGYYRHFGAFKRRLCAVPQPVFVAGGGGVGDCGAEAAATCRLVAAAPLSGATSVVRREATVAVAAAATGSTRKLPVGAVGGTTPKPAAALKGAGVAASSTRRLSVGGKA